MRGQDTQAIRERGQKFRWTFHTTRLLHSLVRPSVTPPRPASSTPTLLLAEQGAHTHTSPAAGSAARRLPRLVAPHVPLPRRESVPRDPARGTSSSSTEGTHEALGPPSSCTRRWDLVEARNSCRGWPTYSPVPESSQPLHLSTCFQRVPSLPLTLATHARLGTGRCYAGRGTGTTPGPARRGASTEDTKPGGGILHSHTFRRPCPCPSLSFESPSGPPRSAHNSPWGGHQGRHSAQLTNGLRHPGRIPVVGPLSSLCGALPPPPSTEEGGGGRAAKYCGGLTLLPEEARQERCSRFRTTEWVENGPRGGKDA
jgi:hypothetical protein